MPEYRDDGEYSDGGSFYPYEEDPYYESYDDEEDAYDDEGERRGANKGIINAAFRRMFRKGKKGTEDSPSVTPARGRSPDESFNAAIVPIEDGVKGVKLFDGDEAVDTRSAVNSTPASPNPFETSVEDNGSRGGSGRASPSMMSPMRLLSPLGSNKVEPTNVVDVQRNDRERRRREKKEKKDRKEARKGEREKIARQPRDFGATRHRRRPRRVRADARAHPAPGAEGEPDDLRRRVRFGRRRFHRGDGTREEGLVQGASFRGGYAGG